MRRLRRAYLVSGALALGVIGCELIVSNSVPDYRCTPNAPGACPPGMFCEPSSLSCVAGSGPNEGGFLDAPKNDSPGDDDDDAAPSGVAIGDPCNNDKPCAKGLLCGSANILTTAVVEANENICTRTCCTSADCPDGLVCFGAGTGGNYCVSAARAKRGTLGTKKPGASCADNGECRSGVCTDDKHCLDLCCKVDDCMAGTTCRVKSIAAPPPAKENWVCAPSEPTANLKDQSGCSVSGGGGTCFNDNCVGIPSVCRPTCCTNTECVAPGKNLTFCAFGKFTTTNSYQKWCFTDSGAGAAEGESCTGDSDCAAHFCDAELNRCARICCQDKDCHDDEICKPVAVGQPYLRCVKK